MEFYLRMEAVNLYNFIEDTADLSTIRGGGLLLLESVKRVDKQFKDLKAITTGASSGLFLFKAEEAKDAESIRDKVESFLTHAPEFKYATFSVDVGQALHLESDFSLDKERMMAKNRWRQWEQPTVVLPPVPKESGAAPCAEDRLRPGVTTQEASQPDDGPTPKISDAVSVRRGYGRKEKQEFYKGQLKKIWPDFNGSFVNSFEELSTDGKRGNLNRKMAVIYADGNSFSSIQQKMCGSKNSQEIFDKDLKAKRRCLLKSLLEKMIEDSGYQTSDGVLRLETLLWGGDEFIWVVPAWRGWETLSLFYDVSSEWSFEGRRLYHAAGIVFCNHKAPIHGITHLARTIADDAKEEEEGNRDKNLFQYLVLESFDHIGQGLKRFREKQFPDILSDAPFSFSADAMHDFKKAFSSIQEHVGIRKVMTMADANLKLASGGEAEERAFIRKCEQFKKTLSPEGPDAIRRLTRTRFFPLIEDELHPSAWLHMAQLWDYLSDSEDERSEPR